MRLTGGLQCFWGKKYYFFGGRITFALRVVWTALEATIGSDTLLMPLKTSRSVPNDPGVASGDQNDRGDVLLVTKSLRFRPPGCGAFSGRGGDPGQS